MAIKALAPHPGLAGTAPFPASGFAAVVFLGVTAGVQMSDRGLQAILSPAIREAFRIGDAEIGLVFGVAGILVASGLAMPLAKLADHYSRKAILLGLILGWAALTAVGALAPNFPLFFVGRAAAGITEFAMIPIVYSLIPDLVGERWRITSNLVFAALMAIGASLGFYLGGGMLAAAAHVDLSAMHGPTEPWRVCMLLLSLAGLPLFALGLSLRDPPRGLTAEGDDEGAPAMTLTAFVAARRTEVLLFLGAAGGLAVAVQALTPMAAMAVVRRFHADLDAVGHGLGLVTLVTSLGALPVVGVLDRALARRLGARSRPAIMAVSALLALPCAVLLAGAPTTNAAIGLIGGFLAFTCLANALIPTMLQDLAPVDLRARAFAAYSFLIAAFCALGPVLSGAISDRLTGGNLTLAISLASVPALVLAIASASASVRRREAGAETSR